MFTLNQEMTSTTTGLPSCVRPEKFAEANSWPALDEIWRVCEMVGTSLWRTGMTSRLRSNSRNLPDDRGMMRIFAVAIAYSQNARSKQVGVLIETEEFRRAFAEFDPAKLARMRPGVILDRHWPHLSSMRFRGKVDRIVRCAEVLCGIQKEFGSFAVYLRSFRIPQRLRRSDDLDAFWERFDLLRADLRQREMPFFRSTTSLLQLLLDLDFDSVKPDLIVMRLARRIGIVDQENGESALRECVRSIQEYSIGRSRRAAVLDLALLAFGGQSGASQLLSKKFCSHSDPCLNETCTIGANHMCRARRWTVTRSNT